MTDLAMIRRTASLLFRPGAVAELRILNTPRAGTVSGYFDDMALLARGAHQWSGKAPAVYATLNPCKPALLARAANRTKERVRSTTNDVDILHRSWLPLDFDPVRPADISSTDTEHVLALERAEACAVWLQERGWPAPVAADSGNGAHRLYAIDLPNDDASKELLRRCLEAVAIQFSDDTVCLDLTVFNASRIWKVYGTMACKGDNVPERPHRLSTLLDVPDPLEAVSPAQLAALAALIPEPSTAPRGSSQRTSFDLAHWIRDHGLSVAVEGVWQQSGYRWRLNPCPWNPAHTNRSAFIVQFGSGAIAAGCHHNGCAGNDWPALRRLYEPDWTPYAAHAQAPAAPRPRPPIPELTPPRQAQAPDATAPGPALVTTCAADVAPQQARWLWYPYIAHGMLCMVDGDPGTGKSLLLTQLAATLSRGYAFPDQCGRPGTGTRPPQNVLLMTREDSPSVTIRPRLDADGADTTRIFIASTWLDVDGKEQAFTLKHLPLLAAELQARSYGLVVLDPIQSFFGDADMHRANQTRPLMDGLGALADTFQCAIVCVRHAAKPGEGIGKAMLRGLGSVDIVGAARTALFVEQYPGDDTRALMAQTKSNLGPKGRTQIFSKCEGAFAWERASRLTDEDLAGSGRGPNHRAFLEALLWLEKRLEGNQVWPEKDIETEAKEQDIGSGVLKRAKKALRVVSAQIKGDAHAGWTWRLPPLVTTPHHSPPPSPPPPSDSSDSTETSETTETPDYKTTTYGDSGGGVDPMGVRGSEASDGSEVSEVSVGGGTVTPTVDAQENTYPEAIMVPLQPPSHCPGCGIVPAWLIRKTSYACHKCHTEAPRWEVQP